MTGDTSRFGSGFGLGQKINEKKKIGMFFFGGKTGFQLFFSFGRVLFLSGMEIDPVRFFFFFGTFSTEWTILLMEFKVYS